MSKLWHKMVIELRIFDLWVHNFGKLAKAYKKARDVGWTRWQCLYAIHEYCEMLVDDTSHPDVKR